MTAIWANSMTRITTILLIVVSVLESALCVAAHSLGRRQADAVVAQVKDESDEARKRDAERLASAEAEQADLSKQLGNVNAKLEDFKAKLDDRAEKLAAAEKEIVRLRADRDAAVKQMVDLTRKYEARIKDAEDAAEKSREAERRARLAADSVKRDAVADAADAVRAANKKKPGGKNGKPAAARGRGSRASLPRTTPSFSELDTNQDGRLSLAEYKAGYPDASDVEQEFKALDTNHDGYLSIDEYKAGHPDPPVVRVPRAKKN
jgi:DNA repair exonuclease SbcCD ATPase subunit